MKASNLIKILSILAFASFLGLMSCGNQQKKVTTDSDGVPKAEFDTLFHDFGSVHQGERVAYTFTLQNQGTANLVIQDVIASCGCTIVQFPTKPIAPQSTADVLVEFDTAGRKGMQYKHILVKTNTPKKQTTLSIKANVVVP